VFLAEQLASHLRGMSGVDVVVRHIELEKMGLEKTGIEKLALENPELENGVR